MPTDDTQKHVKFAGLNQEARHAPANEFLGSRLSERLGVARPPMWTVEVPAELVDRDPTLGPATDRVGFGVDRMPWSDLSGAAIAEAAAEAPDEGLLAQHVALTWLQVSDHESHNFMQDNERVLAIDFASGPPDAAWEGREPLGEDRRDHGGLHNRLAQIPAEVRRVVRDRIQAIDASVLDSDLDEMPAEWATPEEKARIRDELLRVREAIINDLL